MTPKNEPRRVEPLGSAEVDDGLGYAGYLDQLLSKDRVAEAVDRIFREIKNNAHGNWLGLIFCSGGRCTLTRKRQRRVSRLRGR